MRQLRSRTLIIGTVLLGAFVLNGCAAPSDSIPSKSTQAESTQGDVKPSPSTSAEEASAKPTVQEASCEWDEPMLSNPSPVAPEGQSGELADVLVGSWQHTHIDDGGGFEAVSKDIRYVFPSTDQILYCQHVPGVTEHAENSAAMTLEGNKIGLPAPAKGYQVLAWSKDAMLWLNPYDDSRYLLIRR